VVALFRGGGSDRPFSICGVNLRGGIHLPGRTVADFGDDFLEDAVRPGVVFTLLALAMGQLLGLG
jgi:hypothetical protein